MFKLFEGLVNPFPPAEPTPPPKGLVGFCLYYARGIWPLLLVIALLSTLIAVLEVTLFSFMGDLVDLFAVAEPTTFLEDHRQQLLWMALVVLVILPVCVVLQSLFAFQSVIGNFPMRIRWLAHNYLLKQSLSFYQDEFAGRVATKVMQTALSVRETVMKLIDLMVYVAVYFFSIVALLFTIDWRLALPLVAWFVAYVVILREIVPRLKNVSQQQADARSLMTGRIVDSYTNIMTVKLFSHHQRETNYARSAMDSFLQTVYPQMRLVTVLEACVWAINSLLLFSLTALSIWLWQQQVVTGGDIAIAISACLRIYGMSQWIMWEVAGLFEHLGTVQDGINTLTIAPTVTDSKHAKPLKVCAGEIKFHQLTFGYEQPTPERPPIFNDLNLTIKAGEKIGLVGRSGAGKSSLVNLLLRFYDVSSGRIEIDGQAIDQVGQESLRASIGMVTQDTSLLHRSVRENIMYGRLDATEEMIIEAAKRAEAHDFIMQLTDAKGRSGYDAQVGERGVKLSGGQRQRIAIARVILKDAPILILDEATSALDSEVEELIQRCLNQLMESKTVLAIAHRLSTIKRMDRLLVMEQGRIVEQGSHEELLAMGGIYAGLWQRQTGGFIAID